MKNYNLVIVENKQCIPFLNLTEQAFYDKLWEWTYVDDLWDYLDENTFLYYEELILAKKLKEIKKKELVDNRVVVIHDHSATIDKNVNRIRKYKTLKESQRYYVEKYLNANKFNLFLLLVTNKLTLFTKHIKNLFRR